MEHRNIALLGMIFMSVGLLSSFIGMISCEILDCDIYRWFAFGLLSIAVGMLFATVANAMRGY